MKLGEKDLLVNLLKFAQRALIPTFKENTVYGRFSQSIRQTGTPDLKFCVVQEIQKISCL